MNSLPSQFKDLLLRLNRRYEWFTLESPKHSILNHELFWIYAYITRYEPPLLFESGLLKGRSTVILAEMMIPYGRVIGAHFYYPDEDGQLLPFVHDYPNLEVVKGRGEEVAKTLPDSPLVAVVDGPKPAGRNWGRPGWPDLLAELMKRPLQALFQHDVSIPNPKREFEEVASLYPTFKVQYIPHSIDLDFFDKLENYKANLGMLMLSTSSPTLFNV